MRGARLETTVEIVGGDDGGLEEVAGNGDEQRLLKEVRRREKSGRRTRWENMFGEEGSLDNLHPPMGPPHGDAKS